MTREEHIDRVAGIVKRVGTLVYQDHIGIGLKYLFGGTEGAPVCHRHSLRLQTFEEFSVLDLRFGLDAGYPGGIHLHLHIVKSGDDSFERAAQIAYHRRVDMAVAVNLLGVDLKLYELAFLVPFAVSATEKPVQARSYKHNNICLLHYRTSRRNGAQGMVVGKYAFRHRHRIERNTGLLHESFHKILHLCLCGPFAQQYGRFLRRGEHLYSTVNRCRRGDHGGSRINRHLQERLGHIVVKNLAESRGGYIQIYTSGTTRHSCTVGTDNSGWNILGLIYTISRLNHRFGDIQLIKPFICSLQQVYRFTHRRS